MAMVCQVCNANIEDDSAIVSIIICSRKCEDRAFEQLREDAGVPCGVCLSVDCNCETDARDAVYNFGAVS
jgi:hypothetical protein